MTFVKDQTHQGDRQQLLQRLRRCRLGKDTKTFDLEVDVAKQVTEASRISTFRTFITFCKPY